MPSPISSGTRFPALPLGCKPSLAKLSPRKSLSPCPQGALQEPVPSVLPREGFLRLLLPAGSESLPRQSWALRCFKQVASNTYSASILKPDSLFGLFKTKHITGLLTQETGGVISNFCIPKYFHCRHRAFRTLTYVTHNAVLYKLPFLMLSKSHLLMDHKLQTTEKENFNLCLIYWTPILSRSQTPLGPTTYLL